MKDWKSIKVKGELMKDIEGIIEGSDTSRIGFATDAIEKEIKRIKKERYEQDMQKLVDEYKDNIVPYSRKGIKSMEDYVDTIMTNVKDIKRLEKKLEDFIKVEEEDKEIERDAEQYRKEDPKTTKAIDDYVDKQLADMKKQMKKMYKRSRKSN